MKKLPILITYIKTPDNGKELRYALRSLMNIKNFDGNVWIVGEKESWFYNLNHLPIRRLYYKPYLDQINKIKHALQYMPDDFILGQDDIYVMKEMEIKAYHLGELKEVKGGLHKRTKTYTRDKLLSMGLPIKDFEAHALMVVNKAKLAETIDVILSDTQPQHLQIRSMYGNMHNIESELFEDKKTKTSLLKEGNIVSTNHYTPELHMHFPIASRYEVEV